MPQATQHTHNRAMHLDTSKLEQWLSEFDIKNGHSPLRAPKKNLTQFGLKHAHELMTFLNSPRGHAIKGMIVNEIFKKSSALHVSQMVANKKRRRLALIFLAIQLALSEEKAEAKHLNYEIQKQIDELLRKNEQEFEEEEARLMETHQEELALHHEVIKLFEDLMDDKSNELNQIEFELDNSPIELAEINHRYDLFAEIMGHFDSIVDDLSPNLESVKHELGSYAKIISGLLDDDNEADVKRHMLIKEALHHKAKMMSALQTAQKEERVYYNRHAEPVNSPANADFFIPKGKILALDPKEGQYYLISQNKVLSQLDHAERKEALQAYLNSKNDIMSVRMQLELKRAQELSSSQSKQLSLTKQQRTLKQEIQQLRALQENAIAKYAALQQNPANTNAPRPSPASSPSPSAAKYAANSPQRRIVEPQSPAQKRDATPQASSQQRAVVTQSAAQRETNSLTTKDPATLNMEQLRQRKRLMDALSSTPATAPSPFSTKPKPR